jgi:hypothetical protein
VSSNLEIEALKKLGIGDILISLAQNPRREFFDHSLVSDVYNVFTQRITVRWNAECGAH